MAGRDRSCSTGGGGPASLTPDLFRHEARVLRRIGSDALWAPLIDAYDEPGGWVALVLADVEGTHPDLTDPHQELLVLDATDRLAARLDGCGGVPGLGRLRTSVLRYQRIWPALPSLPVELLPRWCLDVADEMHRRQQDLLDAVDGNGLAHNDIRNDDLLVRPDGSVVFLDWEMSRSGARWMDPLVIRLEWVDDPVFDELVATSPVLASREDVVTTFLYTFGAWLAFRSTEADDVGLPTLDAFRRRGSARILEGARRRLGVG